MNLLNFLQKIDYTYSKIKASNVHRSLIFVWWLPWYFISEP